MHEVFEHRIVRPVHNNANGTFATPRRYVYDDGDIIVTYDGMGARINRYLVGPNVDEILANENSNGKITWSVADDFVTVRDLVQYNDTTIGRVDFSMFRTPELRPTLREVRGAGGILWATAIIRERFSQ